MPTVPSAQITAVKPVTTLGQQRPETRGLIAIFKGHFRQGALVYSVFDDET
jgi:hypothetical protein